MSPCALHFLSIEFCVVADSVSRSQRLAAPSLLCGKGFFQIRLELSIVTSIRSRNSDSDTPLEIVKGEEDVATVYLLSGNTVIKDSCVASRRG